MDAVDDLLGQLNFLKTEWKNAAHESMRSLLARLIALKKEKAYEDVLMEFSMRTIVRHAHDVNFVAHLLYLVDERHFPVIHIQRIAGIQEGHLYRTLKRAGVEFDATQSKTVQFDDQIASWPLQLHVDPLRQCVLIDGREYAFDDPTCPVKVWLDEEEVFRVAYREGFEPFQAPLPEYRRTK